MARGDVVHCALCGRRHRDGFSTARKLRDAMRLKVEREDGSIVGVELPRGSTACWYHTVDHPHPEKRGLSVEARMQIARRVA